MSLVGNLEDLGLAEILQIINLSRKSGLLNIENEGKSYVIVFRNGQVISAYEKDSKRHLGHAVIERDIMTIEEFNELARMFKEKGQKNETLKEFIIRKSDVPRELIEDAVVEEVEEIVFKVFSFKEGKFSFELIEDDREIFQKIPKGIPYLDSGLNPQYLAMEAVRIREEAFRGIGEPEKARKEGSGEEKYERLEFSELDSYDFSGDMGYDQWSLLRSFIYELALPGGSADVSLMVLRFAGEMFRRAVIFAVRREKFIGVGAVAEGDSGVDPEGVKKIVIGLGEESILKDAYVQKRPVKRRLLESGGDRMLIQALGGYEPAESYAAPLIVAGRVAAVIYCDNAPDTKEVGDTSALEVFMLQAGLVMEKMLLEKKIKEKLQ